MWIIKNLYINYNIFIIESHNLGLIYNVDHEEVTLILLMYKYQCFYEKYLFKITLSRKLFFHSLSLSLSLCKSFLLEISKRENDYFLPWMHKHIFLIASFFLIVKL